MAEEHVEDHPHALNHTAVEDPVGDRVTKGLLSFYTVFNRTMHIDTRCRSARDCTEEDNIFTSIKQAGQQRRPEPVQGQVQNDGNSASMQAATASVNGVMNATKNQHLAILDLGHHESYLPGPVCMPSLSDVQDQYGPGTKKATWLECGIDVYKFEFVFNLVPDTVYNTTANVLRRFFGEHPKNACDICYSDGITLGLYQGHVQHQQPGHGAQYAAAAIRMVEEDCAKEGKPFPAYDLWKALVQNQYMDTVSAIPFELEIQLK
ncbi:hypothetical protein PG996_007543 [Apiospora saccharicola]|uniref:Uncharacterized protein n=1 Tax=Apiospora saccharicola TaxID=335842 RepID=A0ABR1VB48_9PEZI